MVFMPSSVVYSQDEEDALLDDVGESSSSSSDLEKEIDDADRADVTGEDSEEYEDVPEDELEQQAEASPGDEKLDEELDLDGEEPKKEQMVDETPVAPPIAEEPAPIPPAPTPEPPQELAIPEPDPVPEPAPVVVVEDVPDAEFEARMGRIFKEFYAGKISDAEWSQIAGTKGTEKYQVQSGDTMWGMSTTFFGNGFFWPKLWQLNSDYTNPHVLEPGQTIVFNSGGAVQEPTMNITKATHAFNEPEPPRASVTEEQAKAYLANAEIPPPMASRPVLKKIPQSIPNLNQDFRQYDNTGFSVQDQKRFKIREETLVPSYITDRFPENAGDVVEVETGGNTANLYQEIILELDGAIEGDIFTVFKVLDKLSNGFMSYSGYPVEYQGEVEITESLGDDRYRAIVSNIISPIEVGSKVRKGKIPMTSFNRTGNIGQSSVNVVGGQFDDERRLMGTNGVVYLDGGTQESVQEGQILSILKNQRVRNPDSVNVKIQEPIALIKIIHSADHLSTGMVLDAKTDIRPGDKTGPGDRY